MEYKKGSKMRAAHSSSKQLYSYYSTCIIFIAVALFITLSIFSFSLDDPAWLFASTTIQSVHNWCGYIGAQISGTLFWLCGRASYIIILYAWWLAKSYILPPKYHISWHDLVGFLLVICSYSALENIISASSISVRSGGIIGYSIIHFSLPLFGMVGTTVCLITMGLIGGVVSFSYAFQYCFTIITQLANYTNYHITPLTNYIKIGRNVITATIARLYSTYIFNNARKNTGKINSSAIQTDDNQEKQFWNKLIQESNRDVLDPLSSNCDLAYQSHTSSTASIVSDYKHPDCSRFFSTPPSNNVIVGLEHTQRAKLLEEKLARFGIRGKVTDIRPGPVVTLYEYEPEVDAKISKIVALEDDLTLALQALSIRTIAPLPGRPVVGFEVANTKPATVYFSSIATSAVFEKTNAHLPLIIGHNSTGLPIIIDLASTPHMLIAGSTGSGKSVALNAMLISLLCKKTPSQMQLILIDPKRIECAMYADIPHLIFPIVVDCTRAVAVLDWTLREMEDRYTRMAQAGAKHIDEYNNIGHQNNHMPYIVIAIDELADLMISSRREVENRLVRISQMARAAGIHLIVATQRPSVDVVTGLIKVNIPVRISCKVSSKIDSRTILDESGAERLVGKGDMLILDGSSSGLQRVHGAYISSIEIMKVLEYLRTQGKPMYKELTTSLHSSQTSADEHDPLYDQIREFVNSCEYISISLVQRRFKIGYNRSARIMEMFEIEGIVTPCENGKLRKVVRF